MQYRHPIQRLASTRTTPSSVENVAPTGQTWTHGGFWHWLQSLGTKKLLRISASSVCSLDLPCRVSMLSTTTLPSFFMMYRSTHVRQKNGSFGTLFSVLQASMHKPHPM